MVRIAISESTRIAGGVDKDALGLAGWWQAGAGFLEVGTVTPQPQPGNSGIRIGRDKRELALWNRLGFPNLGVQHVLAQLRRHTLSTADTDLCEHWKKRNDAARIRDRRLRFADFDSRELCGWFCRQYFQPNTQGLRELLKPARLADFLAPLAEKFRASGSRWLLKLSPDIEDGELESILRISAEAGAGGWVLTNTSQGLRENLHFPVEGGVSGKPLAERSRSLLRSSCGSWAPKRKIDCWSPSAAY